MPLLPSIHRQARKSQKSNPGKLSSGQRSPTKQKSEHDLRELENVIWKDNRLLAQVLQLKPAEEDQVATMIQQYTQFLKSQIMSDASYSRALEKEHMERSAQVFKLQKQLQEVQATYQTCNAPASKTVSNSTGQELLDQYDLDIEHLEHQVAAVKVQAASGKHHAAIVLREERRINNTLSAEVLASQVLSKQKAKELKQIKAELRRTQVAIARKHPQLGIYDAIALEEALARERGDDMEPGPEDDDGLSGLEGQQSYLQGFTLQSERSELASSPGSRGHHALMLEQQQGSPMKHRHGSPSRGPLPPVQPRHGSPGRRPHSLAPEKLDVTGGHQHYQLVAESSSARQEQRQTQHPADTQAASNERKPLPQQVSEAQPVSSSPRPPLQDAHVKLCLIVDTAV